uniref:Uncharacterized protein n=1 Tax=Acrobeloides nanus TaxID=290746 RepID=A0A914E976_9BILA
MLTMIFLFICLYLCGFSNALLGIGSRQSVSVQGTLLCDGQPADGVLVKLYDDNTLTLDDLLAEGNTNSQGQFQLTGKIRDITSMDPKVDLFHNCHNSILRCSKKVVIYIPHSAVNNGETYSIGTIELASDFQGQTHDCIH